MSSDEWRGGKMSFEWDGKRPLTDSDRINWLGDQHERIDKRGQPLACEHKVVCFGGETLRDAIDRKIEEGMRR